MKKKKSLSVIALVALLAVAVVGGSLAYWNQTSTIENPFDTEKYGTTVVEDFKPDDGKDWEPGVEVNKDVVAVNTGTTDVVVRVKLDETWTRKGETTPYKENTAATKDVYTVDQKVEDDGLTAADKSVVVKTFGASTNWIDGGDGWYYYKVNLPAGETTDKWLDAVELLDDADVGKFETRHYVTTDQVITASTQWVEYNKANGMPAYLNASNQPCEKTDAGARFVYHNKAETDYVKDASGNPLLGYADSDYVLKVTVQSVQPTQEALDAVFGGGSTFTAPSGTTWTLK